LRGVVGGFGPIVGFVRDCVWVFVLGVGVDWSGEYRFEGDWRRGAYHCGGCLVVVGL
jgi:hypothetical protein